MSTETVDLEVKAYLALVASHLADLPGSERDDLLEDLEQHLAEVAAEGEGSLAERLGTPEAYATELRLSAGYPPEGGPRSRRIRRVVERIGRSRLPGIADAAPVRAVRAFLPELRPGWWVLRGYLAVAAPWIVFADYANRDLLVPPYFGSALVGALAIVAGSWVSVALGRRSDASRATRNLARIANVVAVLVGVAAASHIQTGSPAYADSGYAIPEYLHHPDGSTIHNLCPYAADGSPLEGVLLFDQGGRPVTNVAPHEPDYYPEVYGLLDDDLPRERRDPVAAIPNAYPQPRTTLDPETRQMVEFVCPKVVVPSRVAPSETPPGEKGKD